MFRYENLLLRCPSLLIFFPFLFSLSFFFFLFLFSPLTLFSFFFLSLFWPGRRRQVVQRDAVPGGAALISWVNGSSMFNYSFNTAWFPAPAGSRMYEDGLVVRVVECNPNHHSCAGVPHPEWTNAGALAVVAASLSSPTPWAQTVTLANVSWVGTAPPPHGGDAALWGAADPRMAVHPVTGEYYLTWDNCTLNCYPHRTTMLSTTSNPFDPSAWRFHGPLLGAAAPYTGGASLLLRETPPHYAFVGNSNTANSIGLATSMDGLNWTLVSPDPWMAGRPGMWDSCGVAAAAQPERLSDGNYLFLYNIDTGFPYHPSPLGRCAVGWAILDGNDPTKVLARADAPLLTAIFPWETCGGESGKGYACQEPEVVFSTGMKPLGNDEFLVIYGAADTDVGAARIAVVSTAKPTAV
jgi:predicted GH43/DUF377 family glycosyl hydrolase